MHICRAGVVLSGMGRVRPFALSLQACFMFAAFLLKQAAAAPAGRWEYMLCSMDRVASRGAPAQPLQPRQALMISLLVAHAAGSLGGHQADWWAAALMCNCRGHLEASAAIWNVQIDSFLQWAAAEVLAAPVNGALG